MTVEDQTPEEARDQTEEAATTEAPATEAEATEVADAQRPGGLPPPPPPPPPPKRFLRSRDDRVVAGVAGGLGRYFDVDPVIIRIAAVVSIFFGGIGVVAYLLGAIFVPADDGSGNPVPGSRGATVGRGLLIAALVLVALGGFGILTAAAVFATGIGWGLAVVGAIVLIGIVLIATSFRGGARWLVVPALALTIGVGVATAADLDLEGGIGERDEAPASASEIPEDGYRLGVGRLSVDLRNIDWSQGRVLDLEVHLGVGQTIIAVPSDVCVVADAHAGVGHLNVAGQDTEGPDVDLSSGGTSNATPRLVLNTDVDMGEILVINDDDIDIDVKRGGTFQRDGSPDVLLRDANARACAA